MLNHHILIIEDDLQISQFLKSSLKANGYHTLCAHSIMDGKRLFDTNKPALLILDLNLPDGDGREVISYVRLNSDIPILVLSARQSEQEKVDCFNDGADDYLAKPFGVNELLARVKVALKRTAMMSLRDDIYIVDGLEINTIDSTVLLNQQPVHLTPIEFKLLFLLATKPGKVFTHRQLLTEVWSAEYVNDTHYLRIHMGRLRARLEKNPAAPRYILTEAGIGYRLSAT
ncbi:MAG: winged helix-turn-helix domain-containing protein [Methylotenera sp.]|uniref:winged helix-turn-helix domain-containing protein n=1 Tax=Methylotenera sp. TaxID=2051956 RepID=UPI00184FC684|nr:winged helix-turn-helix domain-containing protein [Methylotenera sp.]NOU24865.1 response regulator [Methylotenera sp.]